MALVPGTSVSWMVNNDILLLQNWDCNLLYYGRHEKPAMKEIGVKLVTDLDEFVSQCDLITINVPLTDKTRGMFNKEVIGKMKKVRLLVDVHVCSVCTQLP